jgi:hypothetical protein
VEQARKLEQPPANRVAAALAANPSMHAPRFQDKAPRRVVATAWPGFSATSLRPEPVIVNPQPDWRRRWLVVYGGYAASDPTTPAIRVAVQPRCVSSSSLRAREALVISEPRDQSRAGKTNDPSEGDPDHGVELGTAALDWQTALTSRLILALENSRWQGAGRQPGAGQWRSAVSGGHSEWEAFSGRYFSALNASA